METRHINVKSDFVIRERFRDGTGKVVALPDVDFELRYWVGSKSVKASRKNGVLTNCVADGDALLIEVEPALTTAGAGQQQMHDRAGGRQPIRDGELMQPPEQGQAVTLLLARVAERPFGSPLAQRPRNCWKYSSPSSIRCGTSSAKLSVR